MLFVVGEEYLLSGSMCLSQVIPLKVNARYTSRRLEQGRIRYIFELGIILFMFLDLV